MTRKRLATAAIAVLLPALAAVLWFALPERPSAPAPDPGARTAIVPAATGDEQAAVEPRSLEPVAVTAAQSTSPGDAADVAADDAELELSVEDRSGRVIVGARVELARSASSGFELLAALNSATNRDARDLRTDANGIARDRVVADVPYSFRVTADGFEPAAGTISGGQRQRVQLATRYRILAVVEAPDDLRRYPGLGIVAVRQKPYQRVVVPVVDGLGEVPLALAEGTWCLRAESAIASSEDRVQELAAEVPQPIRIALPLVARETHTGQVVDAITGAPIAGARVSWRLDLGEAVVADADGRFVIAQPRGQWWAWAFFAGPEHPETAGYSRATAQLTEPHTRIELQPARPLGGRVVDPAGTPVPGAIVTAVTYDRGHGQRLEALRTTSDGAGNWALGEVRAKDVYWLAAMAAGHGPALLFVATDTVTPPVELVLTPEAVLVGTFVPSDGRHTDGAVRIRLLDSPTDALYLRKPVVLEPHLADRQADLVDNRFFAEGLRPGSYEVRHIGPHGAITSATVQLGAGRNAVVLREDRGLAITGRITVTGGTPRPEHGYMVVIDGNAVGGKLVRRGTRLLPGGSEFRFEGVATGSYRLRCVALNLDGAISAEVQAIGGEENLELSIDIAAAKPSAPQAGGTDR